jgi:hypothetical protein
MITGERQPIGWVRDDSARRLRDLELQAQFIERRIMRVRYVEIQYDGPPQPMWGASNFDSLDYGLELDLDDSTTRSIIWMQKGRNEAILAAEGPLVPTQLLPDAAIAVWDVTDRWDELGPRSISSISAVWSRHVFGPAINSAGQQVAPGGQSDLCLLTVILRALDGREAVITLGGRDTDGTYRYIADNVSVFFSVEEARKARVYLAGDSDLIT